MKNAAEEVPEDVKARPYLTEDKYRLELNAMKAALEVAADMFQGSGKPSFTKEEVCAVLLLIGKELTESGEMTRTLQKIAVLLNEVTAVN